MNWSSLFGRETGQEEEGLIKKHCFEWTAVNRGMQLKQLKDKQAKGLCIHSFTQDFEAGQLLCWRLYMQLLCWR